LFTLPAGTRTLDASGTGALILNNTGGLNVSGTGVRTLVLTGTNTGNNISAGGDDAFAGYDHQNAPADGCQRREHQACVTVAGTLILPPARALGFPALITVQSMPCSTSAGGLPRRLVRCKPRASSP
jgi:hypothetical protein